MRRRGKGEGGLTRRTDGTWQASYVGSDDRRHYLYAPTRKGAAEQLRSALRDKELGLYVGGPAQTVEAYLASWLHHAAGRIGPRTLERYAGQVRIHVSPAIGSIAVRKLTPQHLADLYAQLTATLSAASIAHLHRVLHSAFDQALRWNLIARNPAAAVKAPRPARREMTVLSPDEVRALLTAVAGDELEALYVLAVTAGLRQGELLGLRWRDVDLEGGWLEVSATLSRGKRTAPKTRSSSRRVKLGETGIRALRSHRLRMAERLLPFRARTEGDVLVFVTELGEPYNGAHITERAFKPLLRRAGLREIRFHDLRHAFASLMISEGVPPLVISQMLGHSTPAMTLNVYGHLMPLDQADAVARLDRVLAG